MTDNLLDDFVKGTTTLKIDGKNLKVKPVNSEKLRFISLSRKIAHLNNQKSSSEEDFNRLETMGEELNNVIKQIIKGGNPDYSDEAIDNLLSKKQEKIVEELMIYWEMVKKEDIERLKKEAKEKISPKFQEQESPKAP